jgi:hypothetical protein
MRARIDAMRTAPTRRINLMRLRESLRFALYELRDENQIWREQRSDSATAAGGELSGAGDMAITSNGVTADEAGIRATIAAA